jgi:hypothetical protein
MLGWRRPGGSMQVGLRVEQQQQQQQGISRGQNEKG